MRRTKIVATYGPATDKDEVLKRVMKNVDVFRLGFAHGTMDDKFANIQKIRKVAAALGLEPAIMADTPGPKIRVGVLKEPLQIKRGDEVVFCHSSLAKSGEVPVEIDIYNDVKVGCEVSIGDGNPKLRITRLSGRRIYCEALYNGVIEKRKGINVKGCEMSAAPPTADDIRFAKFAKKNGLDFVAISFVKSASDIRKVRRAVPGIKIVAKVERREAIDNIAEIAAESDAVMIARGDMALNVDMWEIPVIQDRIIKACKEAKTPVIVATQMLESMMDSPTPTRAEMTDVANAVKAGADSIMLSGESSVGKYPIDAIEFMAKLAEYTEKKMPGQFPAQTVITNGHEGMAMAAASVSVACKTQYIFVPTVTGVTARLLSALRPESTIIAISKDGAIRRSLALHYGVRGMDLHIPTNDEKTVATVRSHARAMGAKRYMIVYGHARTPIAGASDTIRCFWEK